MFGLCVLAALVVFTASAQESQETQYTGGWNGGFNSGLPFGQSPYGVNFYGGGTPFGGNFATGPFGGGMIQYGGGPYGGGMIQYGGGPYNGGMIQYGGGYPCRYQRVSSAGTFGETIQQVQMVCQSGSSYTLGSVLPFY